METNKLHQGDCFELVKDIQDEAIDLIVCDGPYGATNQDWDRIHDIQNFNLNLIKFFPVYWSQAERFICLAKPIVWILLIIGPA